MLAGKVRTDVTLGFAAPVEAGDLVLGVVFSHEMKASDSEVCRLHLVADYRPISAFCLLMPTLKDQSVVDDNISQGLFKNIDFSSSNNFAIILTVPREASMRRCSTWISTARF